MARRLAFLRSSGVDRDGQARGPKRFVMSRRGNDLFRRYLWMAALSAVRFNPAVRALYARVVANHPDKKAIAIGHAMRKLLHLVFAIWKTAKPFDPEHYPWVEPAHAKSDGQEPAVAGKLEARPVPCQRKEVTRPQATSRLQSRREQWSPQPGLTL